MKKLIIGSIFAIALLSPQFVQAQGVITYVSSLSETSTGNSSVGNNSWLATNFRTGNNASGYMLNSVQLAMTDASGNPSGFTALIYSAISGAGINPGSSLGILTGSLNPATGGIFTYTASNLTLSPSTDYFIVLTAGTTIANGAYEWSITSTFAPSLSGGWGGIIFFQIQTMVHLGIQFQALILYLP